MIDLARLDAACDTACERLLAERTPAGHWEGELSTSALSTATAVMALMQVQRDRQASAGCQPPECVDEPLSERSRRADAPRSPAYVLSQLIANGLRWLVEHQNPDGGWGDTVKSKSNISTTMLCRATLACASETRNERRGIADCGLRIADCDDRLSTTKRDSLNSQRSSLDFAKAYIDSAGGIPALIARYGKDRTFSVPILTHCALAGLVDWRTIPQLPFELAWLPARFYAAVHLPVVSYALPALIAIGQVRHHFAPTRNPITRILRSLAISPTLDVLQRIQPANGGFLEAAPLTSFVTMSLAGMGLSDHPVAVKGVEFLMNSVRPDGSWPIDTNLATWVTTLAVNALGDDLPDDAREPILHWLLGQQYREVHPYTNAAPGGWAWTNLPGGVPDADDTPGAVLALRSSLRDDDYAGSPLPGGGGRHNVGADAGVRWLLGLQNRDGGFPTFCRGWGTLPFDRSSPDITAHSLRALMEHLFGSFALLPTRRLLINDPRQFRRDLDLFRPEVEFATLRYRAITDGFRFLRRAQRPDGSWLPLWFGNQHAPDDINPTYGTARVLAAFRDAGLADDPAAQRGVAWLLSNQNDDGGWGGVKGTPSSVEETALAVEILCDLVGDSSGTSRGVEWLIQAVEDGSYLEPSPIGFYFAKLWYFERLYPLIFSVGALRAARRGLNRCAVAGHDGIALPNSCET